MLKKILAVVGVLFVALAIMILVTPVPDEAEPAAEKKVEAKPDRGAVYEKERKENGGYLPQVELDDTVNNADLRADVTKTKVTGDHVAVWAMVGANLTEKMTYKSARIGAVEIYKMLATLDGYRTATIIMSAPGTDAYGNNIEVEAMKVTWTKETIDKVNYDQFDFDKVGEVAEFYSTTE